MRERGCEKEEGGRGGEEEEKERGYRGRSEEQGGHWNVKWSVYCVSYLLLDSLVGHIPHLHHNDPNLRGILLPTLHYNKLQLCLHFLAVH